MFFTYLYRELSNRRKQTAIIAIGMALAIALVIIVNSVAGGVKAAQATVLSSVYGVGTDITISQTATPTANGTRPSFAFGAGGGTTSGGTTSLSQSQVSVARGTTTFAASQLATVQKTAGVKSAAATLSLQDTSFSGTVPTQTETQGQGSSSAGGTGTAQGSGQAPTGTAEGGTGGGGFGGGDFSVDSTTITGVGVTAAAVGPLTSVTLSSGRTFTAADTGKNVAVLDKTYATTEKLEVGSTKTIGATKFTVIGIVESTSSASATATNLYIPLDTAQKVSGLTGKVSNIYVTADSSSQVGSLKTTLEKALPKATVSTESDLASSVSGSLSTASGLVSNLGTWLSIIVLAAAFLIAILFTVSGVTRRTREFGTLKAIGWSNGRIVRQVAGESLVQGLIGGVVGVVVGLIGIVVINAIAPTLSGGAATTTAGGAGGGAGGPGGTGGTDGTTGGTGTGGAGARFGAQVASAATEVSLHAPIAVGIIVIAVALAVIGGLLAGAIGGWRASRLRPAEALRSVA